MYSSVLTKTGMAQLINSQITGASLKWSEMAVGDGNGIPVTVSADRTGLVHECYRASINHLFRDPDDLTQVVAELVILPEEGGYTIREVGIYDSAGNLVVYGSLADLVKPVLAEGSGVTVTIRCRAAVGNAANVTLIVDPATVIATRHYVDGSVGAHSASDAAHPLASASRAGFMSGSDKTKLDGIAGGAEPNQNAFAKIKTGAVTLEAGQKSDTLELAAGANVNITPDAAHGRVTIQLPPTLGVDVTGSAATCNGCGEIIPFQLTDDNAMSHLGSGFYRTELGVTAGLQYSAIVQAMRGSTRGARAIFATGSGNTDPVVRVQLFNGTWGPLKTFVLQGDEFTGNAASATKLATPRTINGQAFDGTADITVPEYAAMSKTTAGYIKLRSSGIIFQWIRSAQVNENSTTNVTFPVAFPSACAICVGGVAEYISTAASQVAVTTWTKTGCTVRSGAGGNGQMRSATIIAIGY